MAQEIKVLAQQVWRPMFNPQHQHKGGRRELTSPSCPWLSLGALGCVHASPHILYTPSNNK